MPDPVTSQPRPPMSRKRRLIVWGVGLVVLSVIGYYFSQGTLQFFRLLLLLGLGLIGFALMSKKMNGADHPSASTGPAVGTHEWRVAQLQADEDAKMHAEDEARQWAQAYRDSHRGAEPPADFKPPVTVPLAYQSNPAASYAAAPPSGTNVFAILSLIFGLLGGLLAIPFGFVALSQVKRTHEGGKGMAIAGVILGFVWLASIAAFYIWLFTASTSY